MTRFGNSAFQATALSKLGIPAGLTEIGDSAFAYCSGITKMTVPANIVKVGTGAFKGCPNLPTISVQTGNAYYSAAAGVLYDKTGTILMQFPAGKVVTGDYAISTAVKEIDEDAFLLNKNITFSCIFYIF